MSLALRLRGETEETATAQACQDRDWVESLMENLLNRLGERHLRRPPGRAGPPATA